MRRSLPALLLALLASPGCGAAGCRGESPGAGAALASSGAGGALERADGLWPPCHTGMDDRCRSRGESCCGEACCTSGQRCCELWIGRWRQIACVPPDARGNATCPPGCPLAVVEPGEDGRVMGCPTDP